MHARFQFAQELRRDAVAAALIRVRRIRETITQHPIAARQRRCDDVDDVLVSRREHQQRFGFMRHRLRKQQLAQRLAERRAARLTCAHDTTTACGDRVRKPCGVRAFSGAVDPFQGNEAPACCRFGHVIGSFNSR